MNFDQAIMAHVQWKTRLKNFINHEEGLDLAALAKDDQCELGKWIHGQAQRDYGSMPLFQDLKDKHANFHAVASKVALRARLCPPEEGLRLLSAVNSDFGKASSACVNAISAIRDGISRRKLVA